MTKPLSEISLKKVYGARLPQYEVDQEEYLEEAYGPAAHIIAAFCE